MSSRGLNFDDLILETVEAIKQVSAMQQQKEKETACETSVLLDPKWWAQLDPDFRNAVMAAQSMGKEIDAVRKAISASEALTNDLIRDLQKLERSPL
jgi:hypothetical protein